ncbi:MAG: phosphoribosyltransferase family protein [bacterium]
MRYALCDMRGMIFKNREEAGVQLLAQLLNFQNQKDVVVVALPRGGVVLGSVIAKGLKASLDIVVPRKIGHPDNSEYAIGALAEGGEIVWNQTERRLLTLERLDPIIEVEKKEHARLLEKYRACLPERDFRNKTIIIVDDGIATGLTMIAGINSVKIFGPKQIVVAVPIASADTVEKVRAHVDEMAVYLIPEFLGAIGEFYQDFTQVKDEEMIRFLTSPCL